MSKSKLLETVEEAEFRENKVLMGTAYTTGLQMPEKRDKSRATTIFMVFAIVVSFSALSFIFGQFYEGIKNGDNCKALRAVENKAYFLENTYLKEQVAGEKKNVDMILECGKNKNYWSFFTCINK